MTKETRLVFPFPPVTYEDDIYTITETIYAKVSNSRDKAIMDAIKEWAKEKGLVTIIDIPEDHLLEILRVGAQVVQNNELAKEVTDEIITECEARKGE